LTVTITVNPEQIEPSIASIVPSSGPIGTFVAITGTNFQPGTTQVSFNGLGGIVRTVSATSITTTVPFGATTGPPRRSHFARQRQPDLHRSGDRDVHADSSEFLTSVLTKSR